MKTWKRSRSKMKYLFWGIIGAWFVVGFVEMLIGFGVLGGVVAIVIAPATTLLAMLNHPFVGIPSIVALSFIGRGVV